MRDTTSSVPDVVSRAANALLYAIECGGLALMYREAVDRAVNDKIAKGNLCQRYSVDVR
jgi:hypothetical protein